MRSDLSSLHRSLDALHEAQAPLDGLARQVWDQAHAQGLAISRREAKLAAQLALTPCPSPLSPTLAHLNPEARVQTLAAHVAWTAQLCNMPWTASEQIERRQQRRRCLKPTLVLLTLSGVLLGGLGVLIKTLGSLRTHTGWMDALNGSLLAVSVSVLGGGLVATLISVIQAGSPRRDTRRIDALLAHLMTLDDDLVDAIRAHKQSDVDVKRTIDAWRGHTSGRCPIRR